MAQLVVRLPGRQTRGRGFEPVLSGRLVFFPVVVLSILVHGDKY